MELPSVIKKYIVYRCARNIKTNYTIVTQNQVYNSIFLSSAGEKNDKFSQNCKFGQKGQFGRNGKVHLGLNVSSFAHNCGCVVNDGKIIATI